MNRETAIHSSDTLVVVDGSRRKRLAIIGAVVVALIALLLVMWMLGGEEESGAAGAAGARGGRGQVPTVSVVVPGRIEAARTITASGTLAARRDQPVGVAGEGGMVARVAVDAGAWVRQG